MKREICILKLLETTVKSNTLSINYEENTHSLFLYLKSKSYYPNAWYSLTLERHLIYVCICRNKHYIRCSTIHSCRHTFRVLVYISHWWAGTTIQNIYLELSYAQSLDYLNNQLHIYYIADSTKIIFPKDRVKKLLVNKLEMVNNYHKMLPWKS